MKLFLLDSVNSGADHSMFLAVNSAPVNVIHFNLVKYFFENTIVFFLISCYRVCNMIYMQY